MTILHSVPNMTEGKIKVFLGEAPITWLYSHNPDGTIHVAPVWFCYEDEKIFIGTPRGSRKASNVRRDGRVTLNLIS